MPSDLEIDDRHIYWINAGWGSKSIGRADLDGTDKDHGFISGLDFPYALALDSRFADLPSALPTKGSTFNIGGVLGEVASWAASTLGLEPETDGWREGAFLGALAVLLYWAFGELGA